MKKSFNRSSLYVGQIFHQRFGSKKHQFTYKLYMLALDVDEVQQGITQGIFGYSWFNFLRFSEQDYLKDAFKKEDNLEPKRAPKNKDDNKNEPISLKQRIKNKVQKLNGLSDVHRIVMLVQVRCFGIYFSPANFYFCYNKNDDCTQMLVEVSNTPWNERHYYLVDLSTGIEANKPNKKVFQVSPFLDLNMAYFWRVIAPNMADDKLHINIVNKRAINSEHVIKGGEKVFEVNLNMKRQPLTHQSLWNVWRQLPAMTIKVIVAIYWQALRLLIKRVPFLGYQKL